MSPPPASAPAANSTIAELVDQRDYNTRIWCVREDAVLQRDDGTEETEIVERRVVEVGSGICYVDAQGKFQPSNPHWEPTPDGFVLRECAYGLSAGRTLADPIVYTTRGSEFRFRPAFLKASAGSTAEVVASVDTSITAVVDAEAPARLVFRRALGDLGDVEILAKKGSLHQNVILNGKPITSLDSEAEDARLSLYTELSLDEFLAEQGAEVRFGSSVIRGAGSNMDAAPSKESPIGFYKTESDDAGNPRDVLHHFFAESPVYCAADGEPAAFVGEKADRGLFRDPANNATYLVESVPPASFGNAHYPLIWDFCNIPNDYEPGEPWIPAITYRVTADFYVTSGTLQILPGTVVKLDPNVTIYASGGAIHARGEPYDYIVFTKTRDNNCGEPITGPGDSPYMCAIYLMSGSPATSVVQYCKMGYGYFGVICQRSLDDQNPDTDDSIAHNIIRGQNVLWMGIKVGSGANTSCHNNLVTDSTWLGIQYYSAGSSQTDITNNTINGANVGIQLNYSTFDRVTDNLVTNTIFCGVDVTTSTVGLLDHNGFWMVAAPVAGGSMGPNSVDLPDANDPYEPCSVGEFYLDNMEGEGAELRDRPGGRSAEDARLNGAEFTVNKPGVAGASVTSNEYWLKHEPDTGVVDIGYHHNRVDRVLDGADIVVSNSGVVLVPGLVVAINGQGKTLRIGTEGKIICTGDPYASVPNVFASKRSVSMALESSLKLYPSGAQNDLQVGLTLSADSIFDSRIRNAVFRGLYKGIKAERSCVFPIKNCRFDQNITGLESSGGAVPAFNNVFAWNKKGVSGSLPYGQKVEFRSNTFDGNWLKGLELATVTGSATTVEDNLFTNNADAIRITGPPEQIVMAHNGFYANVEPQNDGDVVLESSPYHIEGALVKRWFLDPGCALTDAGSRTTLAAKLLPYTTAYDESYDVGTVDIGYHAFTGTGPANPDPDAPTIEITEIRDQFGGEPPFFFLEGVVEIAVETTDGPSDSTGIVQLYVDGEFVGRANPLTSGGGVGANAFALSSWSLVNTDDFVYPGSFGDWSHTVQAVAESLKPAMGRSEPKSFETVNWWVHCLSVSGQELDLSGEQGIEMSALGFRTVDFQIGHQVVITTMQPGWEWGFPAEVPFDPTAYDHWQSQRWQVADLGVRTPRFVVHETWDGRDSQGQQVYDGLYRLDIGLDMGYPQMVLYSWVDISAFSTPITEAEVALFLPDFKHWDVVSAQAVIDACWRLSLPYRVLTDQSANWDNLRAFLTCPRPPETYPSVLYVSCHGYNILDLHGQKYTVTYFCFGDDRILATTSPPEGNLPLNYVQKHHFISDPAYGQYGLKDPRYLDEYGNPIYELSETGWVKFVWMHACYSNVIPLDDEGEPMWTISDMATAFGMGSDENREPFGDQSYIGFIGPTPFSWYNQWISTVYTWTFWYYLSEWGGAEPMYPVEQVWAYQVPDQITLLWPVLGYPWTPFLEYMVALCDVFYYSLTAKLKDHR